MQVSLNLMLDKGLMSTRVRALRGLGKWIDIMTYKKYPIIFWFGWKCIWIYCSAYQHYLMKIISVAVCYYEFT